MKSSLINWEDRLMRDLRDPETAQLYIQACMEEGVSLQTALRDVIKAQGFALVAKKAQIARPNLLRAVRPSSNPTFETMERLLHSVGLDFSVRPWKVAKNRVRTRRTTA